MPRAFIELARQYNKYTDWKKAFYQAKYDIEYGVPALENIFEESLRQARIEGGDAKYD